MTATPPHQRQSGFRFGMHVQCIPRPCVPRWTSASSWRSIKCTSPCRRGPNEVFVGQELELGSVSVAPVSTRVVSRYEVFVGQELQLGSVSVAPAGTRVVSSW
jgi:hypothetical protein